MSDAVLVACPHCHTLNRFPQSRLSDKPNCGKCRQPIFSGHPLPLNSATFTNHVSKSNLPILVDFWAPWCGPCKSMAPAFAAASTHLEPRLRLAKVDTEAEQELAGRFAIRSIPTMILFKNGHEHARISGAMSTDQIIQWVQGQL